MLRVANLVLTIIFDIAETEDDFYNSPRAIPIPITIDKLPNTVELCRSSHQRRLFQHYLSNLRWKEM